MSQTREALEKFIRWVMRDVTYHKHYSATVMGQLGDELEVRPDDSRLASQGLSKVKIMHGLPGVSVKVPPGGKVTLYFEDGNPQKPRVHSWDSMHLEISFASGVMPVARVGDTAVINPLGLTVGGVPVVGTATATIVGGAPTVKA